ncbi:MAG: glycosyltransferase family 4 protein [Anaeromyxobacteraceae bacterium]
MKVLLLNHYFWPYDDALALLAADLAEDLARAGHEVTVLASSGTGPGGTRLLHEEAWGGVRIVRTRNTVLGKGALVRRVADYATYFASAFATALTLPRPDVVVATSAPPLLASVGLAVKRLRGARLVYWLQDLYPELAVAFGVLGARSPATWLAERVSRAALRGADAVVVPGEPMKARVAAKGVDPARVHVLPNWADGENVRPVPPEVNAFRQGLGLGDRRVVLYSGNMGRAHDLDTLVGLARRCRERDDLAFVFVGGGGRRGVVEAAARELPNVRLLPFVPREGLAESLSAGDVHLVSQTPETLGLMEPSKLYGILAAGRPALYVGPPASEVARTIVREGAGEVVANGDVEGARAALDRLLRSAPTSAHVRSAFEVRHERRVRTAAIARVLTDAR